MRIIGGGIVARSLVPLAERHMDTVAFASGVSDSSCTDQAPYEREISLLRRAIDDAQLAGERLVYFSSGAAVYGKRTEPASEDSPLAPVSEYGRHKVRCESLVQSSGIPFLIVRLPNLVGDTGNVRQLVPNLVAQVAAGRVQVHAKATRDLVDAADLANVISSLVDALPVAAIVNVATGRSMAAPAIVDEICHILGAAPRLETLDGGDAQEFDPSRLRSVLGRDPFAVSDYSAGVLRRHVPHLIRRLQP